MVASRAFVDKREMHPPVQRWIRYVKVVHRMSGSTAIGDFTRQAWLFASDKKDKNRKLMVGVGENDCRQGGTILVRVVLL